MTRGALRRYVPSLVLFGALLLIWQVVPPLLRIREYLLPGPVAVVRAALNFSIPWHAHIWITTLEILGGFALAGLGGVALGVAIAWSETTARALVPFLVVVNTLPKVAVAPLFLLWLGYGVVPNVLIAALIGFFPVVINTAVGLTQIDEELLDLGRVFGAPMGHEPSYRYYAEWEFPDRDAFESAARTEEFMATGKDAREMGIPVKVMFADVG